MKICQRKRKTAAMLDYNEMVISTANAKRMLLVCVEIPPL